MDPIVITIWKINCIECKEDIYEHEYGTIRYCPHCRADLTRNKDIGKKSTHLLELDPKTGVITVQAKEQNGVKFALEWDKAAT